MKAQVRKAETFLALHHASELLVLPNVWDPLGARLLESLGYPAVATASAAVAYSLGYDDGERIAFDRMLAVVRSVAASVDVPVTADIERGYAEDLERLADNILWLLEAGAVGVNLEDSFSEGGALRDVAEQCRRIRAVRDAAAGAGIPLVVNARIDVYLSRTAPTPEGMLRETIARGRAYLDAGADCLYPIGAGDRDTLAAIVEATGAPVNVYARKGVPPMRELEEIGVRRLSLGPGLLKTSLTAMKRVAEELRSYGSYEPFTEGVLDSEEIVRLLR